MRRPVLLLALFCVGLLGAMAAKPLLDQPPPVRAHCGAGEFDAQRAQGPTRVHPRRPAAAPGRHRRQTMASRSRLIAQLRQIGLQPDRPRPVRLQRALQAARRRPARGSATSSPCSDRQTGKALLLNAHYDSTPVGPGAADDGIGVATLLEVGVDPAADRPLKRPVILLFNEGEELGLIGARAFLADPLSRNVDALINLEARGVAVR